MGDYLCLGLAQGSRRDNGSLVLYFFTLASGNAGLLGYGQLLIQELSLASGV